MPEGCARTVGASSCCRIDVAGNPTIFVRRKNAVWNKTLQERLGPPANWEPWYHTSFWGHCACGHRIKKHFRIRTKNGREAWLGTQCFEKAWRVADEQDITACRLAKALAKEPNSAFFGSLLNYFVKYKTLSKKQLLCLPEL